MTATITRGKELALAKCMKERRLGTRWAGADCGTCDVTPAPAGRVRLPAQLRDCTSIAGHRYSAAGSITSMLSTDTYSALLTQGRRAGAEFAEIYVERWRRRGLRTINGAVEEATSSIQLGAGVRLFFGEDVVYGYTNDLSEPALTELVVSLAAMKVAGSGAGSNGRPDASGSGGLDLRKLDAGPDLHAAAIEFSVHDKRW